MVSGALPHRVQKIHDHYGEIVRVAPNELSFTNPAAWRDIHTKNFQRPREYKDKPPGKNAENLISADESDHTRFRKILAPAFSEKSIQEQQPVIMSYINLFIQKLHEAIEHDASANATVIDVLKWFNYTTFDIIGGVLWGSSFGCLDEARSHPWLQVISQFKAALIAGAFKFYPPLDDMIMLLTPKSALAGLMEIWKTTEEKIADRLAKEVPYADVIAHVLAANESASDLHMSFEEIEVNAMMIVVGGSESVTTVLTGIINYLIRSPSKIRILVDEIRQSFQTEDSINITSLSRLPYLTAVIHEGLRLCPTIPDGMRRQIPVGGATVAGHYLPEGTVVSIPQWSAYQSRRNFHSPTCFIPERWLPDSLNKSSIYCQDRKEVFHPFSLGPHNCPGQNLAYLEMRLILARMLWNFDIEAAPGTELPKWDEQSIYWFWDKQPTYIRIRKPS